MRSSLKPVILLPALALTGCLGTVADVVTAPVRAAGKAVDLATTSQSEADQKRGRRLREKEEDLGRLARELEQAERRCAKGRDGDCRRVDKLRRDIAEVERRRV